MNEDCSPFDQYPGGVVRGIAIESVHETDRYPGLSVFKGAVDETEHSINQVVGDMDLNTGDISDR